MALYDVLTGRVGREGGEHEACKNDPGGIRRGAEIQGSPVNGQDLGIGLGDFDDRPQSALHLENDHEDAKKGSPSNTIAWIASVQTTASSPPMTV